MNKAKRRILRAIPFGANWARAPEIDALAGLRWWQGGVYLHLFELQEQGLVRSRTRMRAIGGAVLPVRQYQLTQLGVEVAWPEMPAGAYR
jgi:hypothetical protein